MAGNRPSRQITACRGGAEDAIGASAASFWRAASEIPPGQLPVAKACGLTMRRGSSGEVCSRPARLAQQLLSADQEEWGRLCGVQASLEGRRFGRSRRGQPRFALFFFKQKTAYEI